MRAAITAGIAMAALGAAPALSHHSTANFDFTRNSHDHRNMAALRFHEPAFIHRPAGDGCTGKTACLQGVHGRAGGAGAHRLELGDLKAGDKVTITGNPDRKDPSSCT